MSKSYNPPTDSGSVSNLCSSSSRKNCGNSLFNEFSSFFICLFFLVVHILVICLFCGIGYHFQHVSAMVVSDIMGGASASTQQSTLTCAARLTFGNVVLVPVVETVLIPYRHSTGIVADAIVSLTYNLPARIDLEKRVEHIAAYLGITECRPVWQRSLFIYGAVDFAISGIVMTSILKIKSFVFLYEFFLRQECLFVLIVKRLVKVLKTCLIYC